MTKKLLLIIVLTAGMTVSADTQTNSPTQALEDILNNSPTVQQILQMTPEQIEEQKLFAEKIMTHYCSSQMTTVLVSIQVHGDNQDIIQSKERAEIRDQAVDDFLRRCGWMLK